MFAARNAFMTPPAAGGVQFKDVNAAAATTVTIPSHSVGDIIVIAAGWGSYTLPVAKPSASGTVPTWTDIGTPAAFKFHMAYTVATATDHTSGTWTRASAMFAVVLSGQNASNPIGGYAVNNGGSGSSPLTAPAITLSDASGKSAILHFGAIGGSSTQWTGAAASGYTTRITTSGIVATPYRMVTKDTTTSAGSVSLGAWSGSSIGEWSASLEILSA